MFYVPSDAGVIHVFLWSTALEFAGVGSLVSLSFGPVGINPALPPATQQNPTRRHLCTMFRRRKPNHHIPLRVISTFDFSSLGA